MDSGFVSGAPHLDSNSYFGQSMYPSSEKKTLKTHNCDSLTICENNILRFSIKIRLNIPDVLRNRGHSWSNKESFWGI